MKSELETAKKKGDLIYLELSNGTHMICNISDIRDDVIIVTHIDGRTNITTHLSRLTVAISAIATFGTIAEDDDNESAFA